MLEPIPSPHFFRPETALVQSSTHENDNVLSVLLLDVVRQHGRVGEVPLAGGAERPGVAAFLVGLVNGLVVTASSIRPESQVALGALDASWKVP
jgi:hypothetical protein